MITCTKETTNIVQLSTSFFILFTSILSLEVIVEPLLHSYVEKGQVEPRDGYRSLAIAYTFNTISCVFAASIVSILTPKWSMFIGTLTIFVYQIGFLNVSRYYLFGSSMVVGIGITLLWIGQGKYVTQNCNDKNMARNTSIQWGFYKLSLIVGGIVFYVLFNNTSFEQAKENGMLAVYMIFMMVMTSIAGIVIVFLPHSNFGEVKKTRVPFFKTVVDSIKLVKQKRMILFIFLFFYLGFARSFWLSIFPTCIKHSKVLSSNTTVVLAYNMIATGIGQVSASVFVTILGNRIRFVGRNRIVCSSLILHIILFALIYMSFANNSSFQATDDPAPVFQINLPTALAISLLLGFGDAVLQIQVYAYIVDHYKSESSQAFAIYKFFGGISSTIIFFLAAYFPLIVHLSILTIFATITIFTTILVEKLPRHKVIPIVSPKETSILTVSSMRIGN